MLGHQSDFVAINGYDSPTEVDQLALAHFDSITSGEIVGALFFPGGEAHLRLQVSGGALEKQLVRQARRGNEAHSQPDQHLPRPLQNVPARAA